MHANRKQTKIWIHVAVAACFLLYIAAVAWGLQSVGAKAQSTVEDDRRAEITVTVGNKTYVYRDELLPAPDHTVYEQIERRNINAPLEEKIRTVDKCLSAGAQWREAMRYAFPRLPDFVQKIRQENDREAVDSAIKFCPDHKPMFSVSRSRDGSFVDEKRLYQDIYLALRKSDRVFVAVKTQCIRPAVTVEDNIRCTRKISTFSTSFATSGEGRKQNIRLALSKINGTVLGPGDSFSFNACVGPRSEKNGFAMAKIIVAGEYVEGVGGGVCQASTTLYNAALTAGMKITAVRNHSILPSYVPPSLDAMVNASGSDLCFTNPYETPVFIQAGCVGDTARVTFYGAELPHIIKTVSRVLKRTQAPQDKEIFDTAGKYVMSETAPQTRVRVAYGHDGVQSEGYLRYFSRSGALLREEKIRTDVYVPTQGIVAVAPDNNGQ